AAFVAPTWPDMNGVMIPSGLMGNNWINNPINVQFVHRGLAYLLVILIVIGFFKTVKSARMHGSRLLRNAGTWPLVLVCLQVVLGIFTVINAPHIVQGKFGIYEIFA